MYGFAITIGFVISMIFFSFSAQICGHLRNLRILIFFAFSSLCLCASKNNNDYEHDYEHDYENEKLCYHYANRREVSYEIFWRVFAI